ncbi:MAG TPA: L-threonylcarbamoyladenylate synthase [Chthoniobacterales bacterium]|nr:L-threonylcarbamoyladenylate synthase [Chthoniobacterales bacterium]
MTQIAPSRTPQERAEAVATAAGLLRRGDIVALPTETVYGLAADALNADAVAKIFEAKERPRFDPLIVHLPGREWLDRVTTIDSNARSLVERLLDQFWPGPFTLVLPRNEIVPDIVTAGLPTVAVRISAHPVFSEILQGFASPLAAPSANRFGRISPTTAQHVLDELEGRIPLVVDGGPTAHGLESTIVVPREGRLEILRRGPVTEEQLAAFGEVVVAETRAQPEAPGQLPSHYAPSTPLVLVDDPSAFALPPYKRCGLLAWRPLDESKGFVEVRQLSAREDLKEAATNLFRYLRELDRSNLDLVVAEKLPETGLGAAIMDRLKRAGTPPKGT